MTKPLTAAQLLDRKHRSAVVARAARIRRRSGEYPPGKRLPPMDYGDAMALVGQDVHERRARDQLKAGALAAGVFMHLARAVEAYVRPASTLTYEDRAAARSAAWRAAHPDYHRAYRLRLKCPPGYDRATWAEIVDATQARCLACQAPASRVAHLPDGTPVPACVVHGGRVV